MPSDHFFDQILIQMEAGYVHDGLMQLAGMLDALLVDPPRFAEAKRNLGEHLLFHLLRKDPACVQASQLPVDPGLLCQTLAAERPADLGATGDYADQISAQLPLCRALRDQQQRQCQALTKAWQKGRKILVIGGDHMLEAAGLCAYDTENIHRARCPQQLTTICAQFDLIVLAGFAQAYSEDCLPILLGEAAKRLTAQGSCQFASLTPGHSGAGWLAACLDIGPASQAEDELQLAAAKQGLTITSYRDAAGCLILSDVGIGHDIFGGKYHAD